MLLISEDVQLDRKRNVKIASEERKLNRHSWSHGQYAYQANNSVTLLKYTNIQTKPLLVYWIILAVQDKAPFSRNNSGSSGREVLVWEIGKNLSTDMMLHSKEFCRPVLLKLIAKLRIDTHEEAGAAWEFMKIVRNMFLRML